VIVRIATEGQYEVGEGDVPALEQLDNDAVAACESGDEQGFQDTYARLVALIRDKGRPVPEDRLDPSDVIFPPSDVSFEEAKAEFSGEGLIPG
jgi:PspA-Associated protein